VIQKTMLRGIPHESASTTVGIRPLSKPETDLLAALPRLGAFVFPSSIGDSPMTGYSKIWGRIADKAALPDDVTPHVFRHSFASIAADLGYSEPVIAALIGHKGQSMTSRYVHSADAALLAAADAVATRIVGTMEGHGDE
jgi:integrase